MSSSIEPPKPPRRPDPAPGYRFGPFVFVPEFRATSGRDPWAHRKGEPRVFALLWSLYLMASAMLTIFASRALTPPALEQYRYGCRAMVIMIAIGTVILWPATRLSQAPPRRPARAALIDMLVLLGPVQVVIWPMPVLTWWSFEMTAGLVAVVASWTALSCALVALGSGSRSMLLRSMLMLLCMVAVLTGPLLMFMSVSADPTPRWLSLLSPITALWAIAEAPGSRGGAPSGGEWWLIAAPAIVGAVLWIAAAMRRFGEACEEAPTA
ncbi:MAG: hypothetical protein AAFX05_02475 [Planctomycetota bacterium]